MNTNNLSVIIPTVGLGSRLGELGKFLNKSLLPYKQKPILAHIIDRFPVDTKFIIPVGHNREQVVDFCSAAYPDRYIEHIHVPNYTESFTGPGYTVKQCLRAITGRFFYIPCDSYFTEDLATDYAEDTCFVKQVSEDMTHHYTMCDIDSERIREYKFKETTPANWFAFTGIMFIKDYKAFKQRLEDSESPEIIWTIQKDCKTQVMNSWVDFGNLEIYQNEVSKTQSYDFTKTDEVTYICNNKVVKYWTNYTVAEKKHRKYTTNPDVYPDNIIQRGNWLSYDYFPGTTLYEHNNPEDFKKLIDWLDAKVWIKRPIDLQEAARDFYKQKTLDRIKKFLNKYPDMPEVTHVNDVPIKHYTEYLNNIDWEMLVNDLLPGFTHGDLQFDNIVISDTCEFKVIDWRHEFGNVVEFGDIYYDLAKMYGGFIIDYSKIKANDFRLTQTGSRVYIEIPHIANHEQYIQQLLEYVERKGYNTTKVKLLVPIIFWNMSPLHTAPFDQFLWYLAMMLFEKAGL